MEPFKFGCIVKGEYYCARPAQEAELRRHIVGGQNLFLQGERRMGKSSLAVKSVRSIAGMGLLYVDLLGISSSADFCRRVMDGIVELDSSRSFLRKTVSLISSLRPLVVLDRDTGLPAISIDARSAADPSSVLAVMSMIATHSRERKICVVFDEFQDILDLPDSNKALSEMRSKIQFMSDTSFIFLGSVRNRMSEIFSHPKSPFFKSALEISVAEIDRAAFAEFLAGRFAKGRRKVSCEFILRLMDMVGSVPGDVQELCDALWSVTDDGDAIDETKISEALSYIFAHQGSSYEVYLKQLTLQQRKVLRTLASQGGRHVLGFEFRDASGVHNASSIKKALSRLEDVGHIYNFHDEYKFTSPFFREWILRKLG